MKYKYRIRVRILSGIAAGVTMIQLANACYEVGKIYTNKLTAEKYVVEEIKSVF